MARTKRPYDLQSLILALVFIPPLGLFRLWKSARTLRFKTLMTAVVVLLAACVLTIAFKPGFLYKPANPRAFDVRIDDRGYYINPQLLPFEQDIFRKVVKEMRLIKLQKRFEPPETVYVDEIQPDEVVFKNVAAAQNMDYDAVKAIYLKVASQLTKVHK